MDSEIKNCKYWYGRWVPVVKSYIVYLWQNVSNSKPEVHKSNTVDLINLHFLAKYLWINEFKAGKVALSGQLL